MKVSRKNALLGMVAAGLSGCAGASSGSLPNFLGAGGSGPGGRAPSSAFLVTKGRGAPTFSTGRRTASTAAGSAVLTYTDSKSNATAQAYQNNGAANLYAPNGSFAGQFTTGAVSGGYSLALAHANGTTYSTTMPDPNSVPTGQSTYNGVTFNINQSTGVATGTYQNTTVTASYSSSNDTITINLPDGSTGVYPNVSGSSQSSPSADRRAPEQVAGGGIVVCILKILVAVIVTVMTVVVIGIAIAICASLGWNLLGLLVCGIALLVAFIFVVITIVFWVVAWVACTAPPPPPAGNVPLLAQQQVAAVRLVPRVMPA